jgi:hypothetical protein
VQPFFLGFLQQASVVLASLSLSLAALASALALSLIGVSQAVLSLPFLSLQLDSSAFHNRDLSLRRERRIRRR